MTKLKELRARKNLTQENLGNLLNVSQQTIGHWESGRTIPKPYQMQWLENFFKVPKEEIFFEAFNYKT